MQPGLGIPRISLSFMGVPLAASTRQATTRAADVDSVRLACAIAFHTKNLLQDLPACSSHVFQIVDSEGL